MPDPITPDTVRALLEAAAMTPYLPNPAARSDNPHDRLRDLKVRTTLKAAVAHVRAMLAVHPPKENES